MQGKIQLYEGVDNRKLYLAFSHILINNPLFKAKILEFFNFDIKRVFATDKNDLNEFAQVYPNIPLPRNFLTEIAGLDPDKIYEEITNKEIKFITTEDKEYPKSLKEIEDFPVVLFYKGNLEGINFERLLAVVGSRSATESAKQNVRKIISGFKNTDVGIVSGLATGIDTASHLVAIENNLKTIAVIGSGLDYIYPKQNFKLYQSIENNNGVIFSEYPNSYAPLPFNFPQRNRIITALSKGVVIAEAKMKSGAMISARFALEQGKELMCIPGLITNPNCEGIYHLIKNGAGVVTNTDDILNLLNWKIELEEKPKLKLLGIEKQIYDCISCGEISFEGLKQKLDIGINELMIKLTEMELSGLIIQKNGIYYILGN